MQIIGPLLVVGLILLVVAIVVAARRQRGGTRGYFEEAARTAGLGYLAEDDGRAEAMARDFDPAQFARFASSSLGRLPPENVVHGRVAEGAACLFSHRTRDIAGQARQWFVAIVETEADANAGGLIVCANRAVRRVAEVGGLPDVDLSGDPAFDKAFQVRASDPAAARIRLTDTVRRAVAGAAAALDFPIDVQIASGRVAVYAAERNYDPAGARELVSLLDAARQIARALAH